MYLNDLLIVVVEYFWAMPLIVGGKIDLWTCLANSAKKSATSRGHQRCFNGQRKSLHASEASATIHDWLNGAKVSEASSLQGYKRARYKAVRMRGNYLRTNQPKPGTTAAVHQEIIDLGSNDLAALSCNIYDIHWENFRFSLFLTIIETP